MCLSVLLVQVVRKNSIDHTNKVKQQIDNIVEQSKQENDDLKAKNNELLTTYMQDTFGGTYSCMIFSLNLSSAESFLFRCKNTEDETISKMGTAKLDDQHLVTEIEINDGTKLPE